MNKNYILKETKVWVMPDERIVLLHIKDNNYLVVDTYFKYDEDGCYLCDIGDYISFNEKDLKDTNFELENTQIYNTFLFQSYLKSKNIIKNIDLENLR